MPNLFMMRDLTLMFYCRERTGNASDAQADGTCLAGPQSDDPFAVMFACGIVDDFTGFEQEDRSALMRGNFEPALFKQPGLARRLTEYGGNAIHGKRVTLATKFQPEPAATCLGRGTVFSDAVFQHQ